MFARAGYQADIAAYDAAADADARRAAISDAFIDDLCAIGRPGTWRRAWPATGPRASPTR
jgi:hypothetical protein